MEKHMTNKGFTLIEVIVSVGILAVTSILFITVFARMLEITVANKKINESSLNAATQITNENYTCDGPKVSISYNGQIFKASDTESYTGQMCTSNSALKYKLFRAIK